MSAPAVKFVRPVPLAADAPDPDYLPRRRTTVACALLRVYGRRPTDEEIQSMRNWTKTNPVLPLRCAPSGLAVGMQHAHDTCSTSWCRGCWGPEGSLESREPQAMGGVR